MSFVTHSPVAGHFWLKAPLLLVGRGRVRGSRVATVAMRNPGAGDASGRLAVDSALTGRTEASDERLGSVVVALVGRPASRPLRGWSRLPREGGRPDVNSRDVGLRTAFTGRDNFLVALDTSWNGIELSDGDSVGLVRAGLSLQLFF